MLNNLKTPPLPRGPKMWSNVEKRGETSRKGEREGEAQNTTDNFNSTRNRRTLRLRHMVGNPSATTMMRSVSNVGDSLASLKEAFQTFMNGVSNIENPLDGGIG